MVTKPMVSTLCQAWGCAIIMLLILLSMMSRKVFIMSLMENIMITVAALIMVILQQTAEQLVQALWKLLIMAHLLHGVAAMALVPGSCLILKLVCFPDTTQRRTTFRQLIPGNLYPPLLMGEEVTNGIFVVAMHR